MANIKLIKLHKQQQWGKFQRFLDGFKLKYLQKIIKYHNLTCADYRQQRCIYKSIREANLTYKEVWEAIVND